MNTLNGCFRAIVGAAMAPLSGFAPLVSLIVLSIVLGLVAFVIFRFTSQQRGLERAGDRTRANMLALRLYSDDTLTTFGALGGLFVASFLRLYYAFFPALLILLVIFGPITSQMAMYWQFRPLHPGERKLVKVEFSDAGWAEHDAVDLEAPAGISAELLHRDPHERSIIWSISLQKPVGDTRLRLQLPGGKTAEKQIVVTDPDSNHELHYVNPLRPGPGWSNFLDQFLYPGEPAFAASDPIQRIELLDYPDRSTPFLGMDWPWWGTSLLWMFIGAFAVWPFMKVKV